MERSELSDFVSVALQEAAEQLGIENIQSAYDEARQVERAIENLAELYDQIHISLLKLMWRMQQYGLYAELGYPDMITWALSNPKLLSKWRKETVDRYAKAITRILPEVERKPYITPDGEIINAEALLEKGTITALSDYSYTFASTQDEEARQSIIQSILDREGDEKRDRLIKKIRTKDHPISPVTAYTLYTEGGVQFEGSCSYEQWQVILSLLGPMIDERFTKETLDDQHTRESVGGNAE